MSQYDIWNRSRRRYDSRVFPIPENQYCCGILEAEITSTHLMTGVCYG